MGSSSQTVSTTASQATIPTKSIMPLPTSINPQPLIPQFHKKWFPEGPTRCTGALVEIPYAEYSWSDSILSDDEVSTCIRRLQQWDPYWEMIDVLALTKSSTITSTSHVGTHKNGKPPVHQNRALEVRVEVPLIYQKTIKGWGENKPGPYSAYDSGDTRLLIRMLPCEPPQKPTGKSALKKGLMRSDCHLWPKGTFLMVDHLPIEIHQRKQQSHDPKQWSFLSRMLDATQCVRTPAAVTISATFHDTEPYYLCVAICKYRSPEDLFTSLMESTIEKLSKIKSIETAITHAKNNTVCVIDDDIDHDTNAPSSFTFQLTCPITMTMIRAPVRARQCCHFQCFDLLNFLCANATVSGTRWECPVCSDQVISVHDLQHCAFYQMLLDQCPRNEERGLPPPQIEFFSDGQWKTLDQSKRQHQQMTVAKVVEIIDIL